MERVVLAEQSIRCCDQDPKSKAVANSVTLFLDVALLFTWLKVTEILTCSFSAASGSLSRLRRRRIASARLGPTTSCFEAMAVAALRPAITTASACQVRHTLLNLTAGKTQCAADWAPLYHPRIFHQPCTSMYRILLQPAKKDRHCCNVALNQRQRAAGFHFGTPGSCMMNAELI